MPTIVQTFQGRVTGIWGTAQMRGKDGKMHLLKLGDLVHQGDVILTTQNGIVQLSPEDSATAQTTMAHAAQGAAPDIDRVISALNESDSQAATAAGVSGGDGAGDLSPGLRVDRISESVTPAGLFLPTANDATLRAGVVGSLTTVEPPHATITVGSNVIDAVEEGPSVKLGLTAPTGTSTAATITITEIPLIGELQRSDGTLVTAGTVLTPAELSGLKYVPPADYDGKSPVGEVAYTVTDAGHTATGIVGILLTPVDDAPVAVADTGSTLEDTPITGNVLSNDTDVDSSALQVTQYTIAGVSHAAGTATAIAGVGTLVLSADGSYTFTPVADYFGAVPVIGYTLSDGTLTSNSTLTLAVTPVNDAPDAADDIASTPINVPVTIAVLANDHDRDGDALTVTGATLANPAQGSLVVNPDGTLAFTPATNVAGPVTISYTVSDGHGGSDTASVTVNVGANTAPTGADSTHTLAEDSSYTVAATDFGFADADAGQTLANVRIDNLPSTGSLLLDGVAVTAGTIVSAADVAAGKLVFVPAADGNGAPYAHFTFSVQDSAGAFDTAPNTLTLNVTPVNDAPVATNDASTGLEDAPQTGNVLANDHDVDADPLSVTQFSVGGTTHAADSTATLAGVGTLTIASDGSYTFTPAANYNGPVPVATYTATDGTATTTATLTLEVTPVNDAPVAASDSGTADEDTAQTGNVLSNDTDVDGDTLSVTQFVVGGATHAAGTTATLAGVGTLLIEANGSYTFTPAADYNGPVPVATYTVSDGTATTTATLTLSVTAVADVVGDTVAATEDTPITFNPITGLNETSGADNFEGSPVLTAVGSPAHGTVSFAANGAITYTPDADYNGPDSFTYTVTSGGVAETATISVNVAAVNDAPAVTVPVAQATDEDTGKTITGVSVADVDSSSLTTTLTVAHGTLGVVAGGGATIAGNGSDTVTISGTAAQINAAVAAITYAPVADYNGSDSMSVSTTDGSATTTSSVALTVAAVADIVADSVATSEDTVVSFNPITGLNEVGGADDFDSAGRVLSAVGSPSHGVVTFAADGTITYTPDANYNGADSFQYTVTSGGVTETATITVNVAPVNDAPTLAVPAAQATLEDSTKLIVGIAVADVDGDVLTTTLAVTHGTLTTSAGSGATVAGDGSGTVTLSGTAAQINAALAALTYAPQADYNGSDTLVVSTSDGSAITSASVAIGVTAVADIVSDTVAATEDTPITFNPISGLNETAGADSFEGAPVLSAVGSPAHGAVSFAADGTITYTPVANYHGSDSFSYTVTSGGVTETATITVNVASVNDAPVAAPEVSTGLEDAIQSGNVLSNDSDADGDVLSVTQFIVAGVTHGAGSMATLAGVGTLVIGSNGAYTFTPVADYNGPVPVATYTVSDGTATTTASLTLTVTPVADIVADAVAAVEDTPVTFNPITGANESSGADSFENGGRTLTAVGTPAHGTVTFTAAGTITYTPTANYNGSDSFTYTVTSGGVTETSTITVNVAAVNDAPVNTIAALSTNEDTALKLSGLSINDVDAASGSMTVTLKVASGTLAATSSGGVAVSGSGSTTVVLTGTQADINAFLAASSSQPVFTPAVNVNGTVNLTMTTSDLGNTGSGGTKTDVDTVAITVVAVNDAPVNTITALSTNEDTALKLSGLKIADVDASTGTMSITLNVASGTIAATSSGTVTVAGSGTGTVILTGTLANLNSYLATSASQPIYTPVANANGTVALTLTTNDNGNTGAGGALTDVDTVNITVNAVNDAPVNTIAALSTNEDTALKLSGLSIADVDAASGSMTVTLKVASGTLAATSSGGVTVTNTSATTVVLTGTQADINAFLASSSSQPVFTPAANASGTVNLTMTTSDLGNTGSGGIKTDVDTVAITVVAVNDAPVNTITALSTNEDTALKLSGLKIADVDASTGTMSITLNVASGTIAATGNANVTVAGSGTGTITLTGTLTNLNSYLATSASQPIYTPAANANGTVALTMTTNDNGNTGAGGALTDVDTVNITVNAVNDAPVNTIAALSTNEDTALKLSGLSIADVDAASGAMTVTLKVASGTLAAIASGGVSVSGSGSTTVVLTGTQADINAFLAASASQPVFTPVANASGTVNLTMTTSDLGNTGSGGTKTDVDTVAITVVAVNDAPVNTVPAAQTTTEDNTKVITGVKVADVDSASLTTTLTVAHGTLAVVTGGGATIASNGSATVTISGTVAQINAALASITYKPTADFNGSDSLGVATSDGSLTTTSTVAISVTAVADIVADTVAAVEDTPITFNPITGSSGADNFEGSPTLTAVATPLHGTVTFTAAGAITYTPTANYSGSDSFTYTVTSGGVTETATITVNVAAVNDAPVNTLPTAQTTNEDTATVITGVSVADVDSASLTTTLTVAHGTLGVVTGSGATIGGNGSGTVTISGTAAQINAAVASITYTPVADFNGSDSLGVATSDGSLTTSSSLALTVTAVADVVNDVVAAIEDTVITFNPITGLNETSGADNFESAGRTLTAVGTPSHGTVTFTAAGAITYTPTANYNGSDSFTYTVTSGGVTETATITVNVTPVNDATVPTLSVSAVERWAFDEASGSSTTDAYNAQTGTLSDSTPSPTTLPTWTTGHTGTSGTALHFDGAGSYVALASTTTAALLGSSSLSFWIKTTQTGNAAGWDSPAVIASEQSGSTDDIQWGVLNASGKIGFDVGNAAGIYSTTSVNDNAWHQVAITRDASTSLVSVYVDGVLEATGSPTDAGFTATLNKLTGFGATNNFLNDAASTDLTDNHFLNADLDDVRIYSHVLTADQVAAIKSVESGYHDVAVANDGDAIKLALTATDYTALSVSGLNTGMVISDGAGHTTTIGATGTDTVVDLTGWTLSGLSITGAGTGSATLAFHATDTVAGESQSTTEYLNIVNGTSLLAGSGGNDSLTGTANADLLIGNAGNDTLSGGAGNDRELGGAGSDTLIGGSGNDILYGGAGNDTLTGGAGADVFAWTLTDKGSSGTPAKDVISDFDVASVASGGDTIDLRDLLVGANHVGTDAGNLTKYLDFDTTTTPGSTTIHVSSAGGFTGGVYTAGNEDQTITLQNVDLRASFGLAASATDTQIINELLTRGKLVTDGH